MKEETKPAFPIAVGPEHDVYSGGLTKLEYMALQILSSEKFKSTPANAVAIARKLLSECNKAKE